MFYLQLVIHTGPYTIVDVLFLQTIGVRYDFGSYK